MFDLKLTLALILGVTLAGPAFAQTTETPATEAPATETPATDAPATDAPAGDDAAAETPDANALSLGEEVGDGIGQNYTRQAFDAWELNCVKTADGKNEPCQLYQLLKDGQGTAVAEINIVALEAGQEAVMGATIITPLETLLTENLTIAIDGSKAKRYPFTFCAAIGCIARVGFTAGELDGFKKGASALVSIVPVAAPDQKVQVSISLKGFTAGYEAVTQANAANAAAPAP